MAARPASQPRRPAPAILLGDIPLSVKFKAWWEGYDPAALYALIHTTKKEPVKPADTELPAPRYSARTAAQKFPPFLWSEQRAAANQLVWGPGFLDPAVAIDPKVLRRKLDTKPHHHVLSIGAGLGGFDQLLSKNIGFQVDSFDVRASVIAHTKAWHVSGTTVPQSSVRLLETDGSQKFSRRYDSLFITNSLGRVPSLPGLLADLAKTVRPGAKFVIHDWFRSPAKTRNDALKTFKDSVDPHFASLTDAQETVRLCAAHGFTVSENALITSDTVEAITKPWRMIAGSLTELLHDQDRRDLADELLLEAELWTARVGLAQNNDIEARLLSGTFSGRGER
jgi:SAM-dependent methyltransferase